MKESIKTKMEQEQYMLLAPPRNLTISMMKEFAAEKHIPVPSSLKKKMEIYMAIQKHLSREKGEEKKELEVLPSRKSECNECKDYKKELESLQKKYARLQTDYWRQSFYFENYDSSVINPDFPFLHAYRSEWSLVVDCLYVLYKDEYEEHDPENSFQSTTKSLFELEDKLPAPVAITWQPEAANENLGEVEDPRGYFDMFWNLHWRDGSSVVMTICVSKIDRVLKVIKAFHDPKEFEELRDISLSRALPLANFWLKE